MGQKFDQLTTTQLAAILAGAGMKCSGRYHHVEEHKAGEVYCLDNNNNPLPNCGPGIGCLSQRMRGHDVCEDKES